MDQVSVPLPQKPNLPFAQTPTGAVPPPQDLEQFAYDSYSEPNKGESSNPPASVSVSESVTPQVPPSPQVSPSQEMIVPQERRKQRVGKKNIVLVVTLLIMLGGLVAGFGKVRSFLTSAQGGCEPEGLTETNLTANSVEIVFQTSKACQMEIAYGTSSEALLLQVPEAMASLNHRIRLAPLLASTTYYYQVVTEGKRVGQVRSFLTKAAEVTPPVVTKAPVEGTNPEIKTDKVSSTKKVPTPSPLKEEKPVNSSASGVKKYTLKDFQSQLGGDNPEFDLDKNGVVNMRDWLLYKKE